MKLITARIFDNPIDAHLLKTKLVSEGVECFIFDEHSVTIDRSAYSTSGGIKLQIFESDIEKVKTLLSEIEANPYLKENGEVLKCPNCNSENLYSGYKSKDGLKGSVAALFSFLTLTIPFYFKIDYKCRDCQNEFKLNKDSEPSSE